MKTLIYITNFLVLLLLVACGGGGDSSSSNSNTNTDTTAPLITIIGDAVIDLEFGSTYTELGASAVDETDGIVIVTISGAVITNSIGTYTITYSAADLSGNISSASRVVNINDNIPPSLSLNGPALIELNYGETYNEMGVNAIDNADGSLSVTTSGAVQTNTLGSYEITYSATDQSGNTAFIIRTINVIDILQPNITLNGATSLTIYLGATYTEQGAIANDNVDGDISSSIIISGVVDISSVGIYQITYSVSDSSGNSNSMVRQVEVSKPNYNISLNDTDQTLWEASYKHRFYFSFEQAEPVRKQLLLSIDSSSTAIEGIDFNLLTNSIDEPENSTGSYIELEILDDLVSEGEEFIDLTIQNPDGDIVSNIQILLDDQTSDVITHNSFSGNHFAPSSAVIDDKLFILSPNRIEIYNLLTETTTATAAFPSGIGSGYNDSILYDGQIYVFAQGTLYLVDEDNLNYLTVSNAPQFLEWTSELQVIDDKLYIVGGKVSPGTSRSNIVLVYDFLNDTWSNGNAITNEISGAATATSNQNLYVFGGNGSSGASDAYETKSDSWSPLTTNSLLSGAFDTAVNGGSYIFVTVSSAYTSATDQSLVLQYDITNNFWQSYNIDTPPRRYRDSFLYKGKVYLVGGTGEGTLTSQTIVSYYIGD